MFRATPRRSAFDVRVTVKLESKLPVHGGFYRKVSVDLPVPLDAGPNGFQKIHAGIGKLFSSSIAIEDHRRQRRSAGDGQNPHPSGPATRAPPHAGHIFRTSRTQFGVNFRG
jgi:hypothetical protein